MDCAFLNGRFDLLGGKTVTFQDLVLVNCRTISTVGIISKHSGARIILNNTADQHGSVCLPLGLVGNSLDFPSSGNQSQQITALARPGSTWCSNSAAAQPSNSTRPLAAQLLPSLLANRTGRSICQQGAVLMGDAARTDRPVPYRLTNSKDLQEPAREPFTLVLQRTAWLCTQPVSMACIQENGTGECIELFDCCGVQP